MGQWRGPDRQPAGRRAAGAPQVTTLQRVGALHVSLTLVACEDLIWPPAIAPAMQNALLSPTPDAVRLSRLDRILDSLGEHQLSIKQQARERFRTAMMQRGGGGHLQPR